jgi:hypothetical protein
MSERIDVDLPARALDEHQASGGGADLRLLSPAMRPSLWVEGLDPSPADVGRASEREPVIVFLLLSELEYGGAGGGCGLE